MEILLVAGAAVGALFLYSMRKQNDALLPLTDLTGTNAGTAPVDPGTNTPVNPGTSTPVNPGNPPGNPFLTPQSPSTTPPSSPKIGRCDLLDCDLPTGGTALPQAGCYVVFDQSPPWGGPVQALIVSTYDCKTGADGSSDPTYRLMTAAGYTKTFYFRQVGQSL